MRRTSTTTALSRGTLAWLAAALAACASAGGGGGGDDDDDQPDASGQTPDGQPGDIDAPPIDAAPPIDGPPIDAAVQPVTLTQSTATTITAANSVACANGTTGYTTENSYYRVFPLSAAGISGTSTFTPTSVAFGVEESSATAGSHTIQVRLHSMTGTTLTNTNQLTLVHGQNHAVPNTTGTIQTVTLTGAPAVSGALSLVFEVFVPDGTAAGNVFYIGSNTAGQSAPGYIRAPSTGCDITQPVTLDSLGFATVHMVMSVTGTTP